MSLPIVSLENEERWDCHQCGFCCRGSVIPLSNHDLAQLQSQKWGEHPDFAKTTIMVPHRGSSGHNSSSYRLAHRADGSCVFLDDKGLCRIHSEYGLSAKPTVCQTFPLQLIPHEKRTLLTLRRACPSAAADLGISTAQRLPFIKRLVNENRLQADRLPPPPLKAGEHRDWKTIRSVLESAGSLLGDQRYPPVRRLVHALQFAGLIEAATTRRLNDQQVLELAGTLTELVPEESKPFFSDRRVPRNYSKILFRLLAIDCARLHPLCRHESKWSARINLVKTAWKVARGTGPTPWVDKVFPSAELGDLEKPFGALRPEIYRPLSRFIETHSESFMYALADRRGWSVVESIRGLALLFPVGLWLLRWLAHGREPTVQDMLQIVVALDRSQGYQPLSGSLHRWRLSTLSAKGELERLVVWYAS